MTASPELAARIEQLDEQGLGAVRIGIVLGISARRVEQILDELAGAPVDSYRVERMTAPTAAAPRYAPAVDDDDDAPAAPVRARGPIAKCGTHAGYQRHLNRKEPVCQPCRDARNAYQRELQGRRRAEARAAREQQPRADVPVPRRLPRPRVRRTLGGRHWMVTFAAKPRATKTFPRWPDAVAYALTLAQEASA